MFGEFVKRDMYVSITVIFFSHIYLFIHLSLWLGRSLAPRSLAEQSGVSAHPLCLRAIFYPKGNTPCFSLQRTTSVWATSCAFIGAHVHAYTTTFILERRQTK